MAIPAPWSEAEIDRARELWADGLSAALIGIEIGRSRNSVIGLADRQQFPKRPTRKSIDRLSGEVVFSRPRRKARATGNAKSVGVGHQSSSHAGATPPLKRKLAARLCEESAAPNSSSRPLRAKAGAVDNPPTPSAPAPFLIATGCQWPLQSGPIEQGQHLHMLCCNDPIEVGTRYRRYCQFHADYQHVKISGEAA